MDNTATLQPPAEPTTTADSPPQPPMAMVSIAIEQPDGGMITVMWNLSVKAAEQEITRMRDRHGPSTGSAIYSPEEAEAAAAFIVEQGLRIDL